MTSRFKPKCKWKGIISFCIRNVSNSWLTAFLLKLDYTNLLLTDKHSKMTDPQISDSLALKNSHVRREFFGCHFFFRFYFVCPVSHTSFFCCNVWCRFWLTKRTLNKWNTRVIVKGCRPKFLYNVDLPVAFWEEFNSKIKSKSSDSKMLKRTLFTIHPTQRYFFITV